MIKSDMHEMFSLINNFDNSTYFVWNNDLVDEYKVLKVKKATDVSNKFKISNSSESDRVLKYTKSASYFCAL